MINQMLLIKLGGSFAMYACFPGAKEEAEKKIHSLQIGWALNSSI